MNQNGLKQSTLSDELLVEKAVYDLAGPYFVDLKRWSSPKVFDRRPKKHVAFKYGVPIKIFTCNNKTLKYDLKYTLMGHAKSLSSLKFSADGRHLASASADGTLKIWTTSDYVYQTTLVGHELGLSDVAWSTESQPHLVSASDDKTLKYWDLESSRCLFTLHGHLSHVFCCNFNVQSNIVISGSYDESVRLWDVRLGKCLQTLPTHQDPIIAVDFNPVGGNIFLSASHDGTCRLYDTRNGHCLKTLIPKKDVPILFARFSPNGRYILVSTIDSTIQMWDPITLKCVKTYNGHVNKKYSFVTSFLTHNEQQYVVSGSEDRCVYFWEVNSRKVALKLMDHEDIPVATACHPTDGILATGSLSALNNRNVLQTRSDNNNNNNNNINNRRK